MRASGSRCLSSQMPASPGVMRPSGETAVASAITSPAPPDARAEMDEVPVIRHAVLRGIHAHGRNADAIAERDGFNGERIEEMGHGRKERAAIAPDRWPVTESAVTDRRELNELPPPRHHGGCNVATHFPSIAPVSQATNTTRKPSTRQRMIMTRRLRFFPTWISAR